MTIFILIIEIYKKLNNLVTFKIKMKNYAIFKSNLNDKDTFWSNCNFFGPMAGLSFWPNLYCEIIRLLVIKTYYTKIELLKISLKKVSIGTKTQSGRSGLKRFSPIQNSVFL